MEQITVCYIESLPSCALSLSLSEIKSALGIFFPLRQDKGGPISSVGILKLRGAGEQKEEGGRVSE